MHCKTLLGCIARHYNRFNGGVSASGSFIRPYFVAFVKVTPSYRNGPKTTMGSIEELKDVVESLRKEVLRLRGLCISITNHVIFDN